MTLAHQFAYDTYAEAVEDYFDQGFTDGLPVIPPTVDRVDEMLRRARLQPDDLLGEVPTRMVRVTADKVAANAVMAGCRPEYFPAVVAAVRAGLSPGRGLPPAPGGRRFFLTLLSGTSFSWVSLLSR